MKGMFKNMNRFNRSLLIAILFLLAAHCSLPAAKAQGIVQIRSGATKPAKCKPTSANSLFFKNSGSNKGLYECTATDTWTYRDFSTTTLVNGSMVYIDVSGALASTAAPTNGQLLCGSTGAIPALCTITAVANETAVTNGAGLITVGLAATIKHKAAAFFQLTDSTDTTKIAQFDLSGISTGQTRNVAVPDSDTKLPIISQILTFTGPTAARTVTLFDAAFSVARRNDFNAHTNVAAPATPAAGISNTWTDVTDKNLKAKDDAGVITVTVKPDAGTANQWINSISTAGVPGKAQPAVANLSDASTVSLNTVANVRTQVAAPSTPAAGFTSTWADSTDKNVKAKDDAGVVTVTVKPDAGTASQWIRSISSAGVPGKSQPSSSDLSDAANVAMRNVANAFIGNQTIAVGQTTSAQTDLLINPTTKSSGNFADFQVNGTSVFKVNSAGGVALKGMTLGTATLTDAELRLYDSAGGFRFQSSNMDLGSGSVIRWTNGTSNGGTADTALSRNAAGIVQVGNTGANASGSAKMAGLLFTNLADSATAPTISSGFGSSPSIPANNGTAAFTVNVGTGGAASSGVIGMPTATTGWSCNVTNQTAVAANRGDQRTVQTASTATTITVQNQTISTGAALVWTASDVLVVQCRAY